jgi:hypothetical protein
MSTGSGRPRQIQKLLSNVNKISILSTPILGSVNTLTQWTSTGHRNSRDSAKGSLLDALLAQRAQTTLMLGTDKLLSAAQAREKESIGDMVHSRFILFSFFRKKTLIPRKFKVFLSKIHYCKIVNIRNQLALFSLFTYYYDLLRIFGSFLIVPVQKISHSELLDIYMSYFFQSVAKWRLKIMIR